MMTDTELEIAILKRYVKQYKEGMKADRNSKCLRELRMHGVIREITGTDCDDLEFLAQHWHGKLVSRVAHEPPAKPLRGCSLSDRQGDHKWHARAYEDGTDFIPAQARIDELEEKLRRQELAVNINTMNVNGIANIGGVIQKQPKRKKRKPFFF